MRSLFSEKPRPSCDSGLHIRKVPGSPRTPSAPRPAARSRGGPWPYCVWRRGRRSLGSYYRHERQPRLRGQDHKTLARRSSKGPNTFGRMEPVGPICSSPAARRANTTRHPPTLPIGRRGGLGAVVVLVHAFRDTAATRECWDGENQEEKKSAEHEADSEAVKRHLQNTTSRPEVPVGSQCLADAKSQFTWPWCPSSFRPCRSRRWRRRWCRGRGRRAGTGSSSWGLLQLGGSVVWTRPQPGGVGAPGTLRGASSCSQIHKPGVYSREISFSPATSLVSSCRDSGCGS